MSNRIGIIGVGLLGSALTERLLAAGYKVVGFDGDESQLARFGALGGEPRSSAAEVAADTTRLLLSLPNSDVVESVVGESAPSLRSGTLVIDTTTGAPDKTVMVARRLLQREIRYLDATVAGSSEQARQGDIVIMAGGSAEDFAACTDLFDALARRTFHVGPSGCGSRMKLVVNLVLGLNRAALAEGLTLARASGIDLLTALEVLRCGAAYSAAMDTKGRKMIEEDFTPQARLSQHHKDVGLILDLAEASGIDLPLSQVHRELLRTVQQQGFGELDNSAVIKAFDRSNPVRPEDEL